MSMLHKSLEIFRITIKIKQITQIYCEIINPIRPIEPQRKTCIDLACFQEDCYFTACQNNKSEAKLKGKSKQIIFLQEIQLNVTVLFIYPCLLITVQSKFVVYWHANAKLLYNLSQNHAILKALCMISKKECVFTQQIYDTLYLLNRNGLLLWSCCQNSLLSDFFIFIFLIIHPICAVIAHMSPKIPHYSMV